MQSTKSDSSDPSDPSGPSGPLPAGAPSAGLRSGQGIPPFAAGLLLVVFTLGVYWSVTTHGFVDYDDGDYVTGNAQVQAALTWAGAKWAFTTGHASNWHPLTWLSHQLDVSLFGKNAGGHHLTSVVFHCANAVLVFLVCRVLTGASWKSLCVAGLFALHPLRVESVAWISERKDVLSAFFGLLTLFCYGWYAKLRVGRSAAAVISPAANEGDPFLHEPERRAPALREPETREAGASRSHPPVHGHTACSTTGKEAPREERAGRETERGEQQKTQSLLSPALSSTRRGGEGDSILASTSQRTRQSRAGGEFRGDATNWYALALVCFALGLLCKPMLVTLPFVLLLLDYWPLGRAARNVPELSDSEFTQHATRNTLARLLIEKLPFMLLCLASSLVTFLVQQKGGAVSPLEALTVLARVANAVVSYARYLGKTFWPQDLSVLYPHPGHWPVWQVAAAVALLVCVTLVVILLRRPMPFAVVGWLWFVGMLVPVIGLVQVGIQSMADRYTYLPSVGILIALVWGVGAAVERWPKLRVASGVAAALAVGACGVLTAMQAGIWANSETLFRHAVTVTEKNYLAYNNLGFYLAGQGRMDEAMTNYAASLSINPNYADAHNNMGHALAERKQYAEAIVHYRAALRANPGNVEIHNNFGNALAETGDAEGALAEYQFVLERNPQHADAHNNLGIALAMRGQLNEAMEHFNQALRAKPTDAGAHGNLGNAFAAQRKFEDAIGHYRAALKLSPQDAKVRNNLGNVLAELGKLDEAATNYVEALRLNADNPEAHFNLGCALARLGRPGEAASHFNEVLRLNPNYEAAKEQLRILNSATRP